MNSMKVYRFEREPTFRCTGSVPSFDPATEEQVAEIWRAAAADPARELTDNTIMCVTRLRADLEAVPMPYRYFFAQMVRPELFPHPIVALGVSGIVTCEGKFVLGRRAEWLGQDPGALEFAPSGSLDADLVRPDGHIDVLAQFDREASEELGLATEAIHGHRIVGNIYDEENHVVDVVVSGSLECPVAEVLNAYSQLDRHEYSSLHVLSADELQPMIDDGSKRISAVSSAIFAHFCGAAERSCR